MLAGLSLQKEGKKMSDMAAIVERGKKVLVGNYARLPIVMARGEGSFLWDADGKKYIDLFAGFGGASSATVIPHSSKPLPSRPKNSGTSATPSTPSRKSKSPSASTKPHSKARLSSATAAWKPTKPPANSRACAAVERNPNRWKIITLNKSFHGRSSR
jgi:acetylornithine/N-succinyldiaminopimelate aminotransferase